MPDDERVAVSVLNNRTTQGRAEQNSAPFLESGQHAQARDSGKSFLGFRSRSSGQCCRTRTRTVCHVLDGAAATVLAAWQDVPFGHRRSRLLAGQRSSGAFSGSSRATQTWRSLGCECLGGCHGLFSLCPPASQRQPDPPLYHFASHRARSNWRSLTQVCGTVGLRS